MTKQYTVTVNGTAYEVTVESVSGLSLITHLTLPTICSV